MFHFEERKEAENAPIVKGRIRCRLTPQSQEMQELASVLRSKSSPQGPYFTIREQGFDEEAIVELGSVELERMKRTRVYQSSLVTLSLSSPTAKFEIHLNFNRHERFMLSGLPRQASRVGNWQYRSRLTPLYARFRRSLSLREIKVAQQNWKPPPPVDRPPTWLAQATSSSPGTLTAAEENDSTTVSIQYRPVSSTNGSKIGVRKPDYLGCNTSGTSEVEFLTPPTKLPVALAADTGEALFSPGTKSCVDKETRQTLPNDSPPPTTLSSRVSYNDDNTGNEVASLLDPDFPTNESNQALGSNLTQSNAWQACTTDQDVPQPCKFLPDVEEEGPKQMGGQAYEGRPQAPLVEAALDRIVEDGLPPLPPLPRSGGGGGARRQKAKQPWATCEAQKMTLPLHKQCEKTSEQQVASTPTSLAWQDMTCENIPLSATPCDDATKQLPAFPTEELGTFFRRAHQLRRHMALASL